MNENAKIKKSMEFAVGIAIDMARSGGKFSTNFAKDAYEGAVDEGWMTIFWEDFRKLCRQAFDIFISNGGEF